MLSNTIIITIVMGTDMQSQARGLILDPVSKSMLQARLFVKTNPGFVAVWLVEDNIIIILMIPNLVTKDTVFCSVVGGKQHHHHDRDGETDTQTQARGLILDPVSKSMHCNVAG